MPDEIKCPAHYLGDGVVTCDRAIAAEEIREMIRGRIDQLNNTKDDKDAD